MKEYICAMCGEAFESDRSDEEAYAECQEVFGCTPATTYCDVVCDDCYAGITRYRPETVIVPTTPEQAAFIEKHKDWFEQELRNEYVKHYKECFDRVVRDFLYGGNRDLIPVGICNAGHDEPAEPALAVVTPDHVKKMACDDMLQDYMQSIDWRGSLLNKCARVSGGVE